MTRPIALCLNLLLLSCCLFAATGALCDAWYLSAGGPPPLTTAVLWTACSLCAFGSVGLQALDLSEI